MNYPLPQTSEYAEYYQTYVSKIEAGKVMDELYNPNNLALLKSLTEEQWNYRYEPEKWSVKELIIHLSDSERVFAYRAMRISRQDQTPLPGFDQNDFVPHYDAENRTPASIIKEFDAVRQGTLSLYESFNQKQLKALGQASGFPVSVLALSYLIAGHEKHHFKILKERYLNR